MGDVVDLRARRARNPDERHRFAAAVRAVGGRECAARVLSDRIGGAVHPSTVGAWETQVTPTARVLAALEDAAGTTRAGRAPITGRILTSPLLHPGRAPDLAQVSRDLGAAVTAEILLRYMVETPADGVDLARHPLASCVLRSDVIAVLEWPFTGRAPATLAHVPAPYLPPAERVAFFDHCRGLVDRASRRWPDPMDPQPHRQALYLLQWDPDPETRGWLRDVERRGRWRPGAWTPRWVTARSAAITRARHGDPGPLRQFVEVGLTDPGCQDADLAYWGYYLGDRSRIWRADDAMTRGLPKTTTGAAMADRFIDGLHPGEPLLDLYVASLSALSARRPRLLQVARRTARLRSNIERVLTAGVSPGTRRTLHALAAS
jgi:hypothetical protein